MMLDRGSRVGPYEVVSPIGAGGMGEVYKARDPRLARDVALKVLPAGFVHDPDRIARFRREAQMLAALNHPHIAHLYGLEEVGGTTALVLEFVDGETLSDIIARGRLPIQEALKLSHRIADALEAAHEHGIVHRDLKPANIKVDHSGQLKVLDFGLAKALQGESAASGPTAAPTVTSASTRLGVVLGTAAYMSPEQARGLPVDRRTTSGRSGASSSKCSRGRLHSPAPLHLTFSPRSCRGSQNGRSFPPAFLHRSFVCCVDVSRRICAGAFTTSPTCGLLSKTVPSSRLTFLTCLAGGRVS
jgi:serine/threonine protein kinase